MKKKSKMMQTDGKIYCVLRLEESILLKRTIYRFSAIPIKLPVAAFTELEQKKVVLFFLICM